MKYAVVYFTGNTHAKKIFYIMLSARIALINECPRRRIRGAPDNAEIE